MPIDDIDCEAFALLRLGGHDTCVCARGGHEVACRASPLKQRIAKDHLHGNEIGQAGTAP